MIPTSAQPTRRVVEDVVELRLAGEQVVEHRLARLAEVLGDAVEQLGVADLVLDLGRQGELPAERRRAHEPLALGQDAHQLAVGVHLDEAQDRGPVLVGHPVGRLDLAAAGDVRLERRVALVVGQVVVERRAASARAGRGSGSRASGSVIAGTSASGRRASDEVGVGVGDGRGPTAGRPAGTRSTMPLRAVRMKAAVSDRIDRREGAGLDAVRDDRRGTGAS